MLFACSTAQSCLHSKICELGRLHLNLGLEESNHLQRTIMWLQRHHTFLVTLEEVATKVVCPRSTKYIHLKNLSYDLIH